MTIRGWCPDLFAPMQSGDGMLARVKPFGPVLTSRALRLVGAAAQAHGNGMVELTSRANLQIRGLTAESAAVLAAEMVAAGLALGDPAAERRRSILVSPLAGQDPACHPDTLALGVLLGGALRSAGDLADLPGKFLFVVDGGGAMPLGDVAGDVVIAARAGGWIVDGAALGMQAAVARALALARLCLDPPTRRRRAEAPMAGPSPRVGPLAPGIFGLGLPFGRLDADQLADLADRFGDATLRLTPWRCVVLTGVADAAALGRAAAGLIVSPDDDRLRVIACPGHPACASALADVRADARGLMAFLPPSGVLHLSGCGKLCAHPRPAAVTLVATPSGYHLTRREGQAA